MAIRLYPLTRDPDKLARLSGCKPEHAREFIESRKQIEAALASWDYQSDIPRPYAHLESFEQFWLFGWGRSAAHRHHKGLISDHWGEIEAELVSQLPFTGWDGKPWILNGWQRCEHILFCQAQHSAGLRWAFNEGGMDLSEVLTLAGGVRWE